MVDRAAKERSFLSALERAVGGSVSPTPALVRDWQHAFDFAGRTLFCTLTGHRRFSYCVFGIPLEGRPVSLRLAQARARVRGSPLVRVADEGFSHLYRAHGAPEEVVSAALAPAACRWLVDAFGGDEPTIATRGDFTQLTLFVPDRDVQSPEAIRNWLSGALMIHDALCVAFDARVAELTRAQGPEAARAWTQRARDLKARAVTVADPRALVVVLLILVALVLCGAGALFGLRALAGS